MSYEANAAIERVFPVGYIPQIFYFFMIGISHQSFLFLTFFSFVILKVF